MTCGERNLQVETRLGASPFACQVLLQLEPRQAASLPVSISGDLQHYLSVVLSFPHERVGCARVFEWEYFPDYRMQLAFAEPLRELPPRHFHESRALAHVTQPQTVDACALCVQQSSVKNGRLSSGRAVYDHASKLAEALHAFRDMLAAEHFKHRIYTLALCKVPDCVLIVLQLVIDAVLQAEFA